MSRTILFLNKYSELEGLIKTEFRLPDDKINTAIKLIEEHRAFASIKKKIQYCREVRNFLQHRERINDSYLVEPSEEMISLLDEVIMRVSNLPRAMDIAIGFERIYWRNMDDLVLPVMKIMNEQCISHIPILKNGIVEGVFSDNTIMSFLLDEEIIEAAENMRFSDLISYLPLEAHKADSFRFISRDMFVSDINDIFADAMSKSDRIGLVFVTAHGKKTEKLLGIITAWDLAVGGKE